MKVEEIQAQFQFECQPEATRYIEEVVKSAVAQSTFLQQLEKELMEITSTKLFDWIDHIEVGLRNGLAEMGFQQEGATRLSRIFHHPKAQLPRVVVRDDTTPFIKIGINIDSCADFLMVRGLKRSIVGSPELRRAEVVRENGVSVSIIERRAGWQMEPSNTMIDTAWAKEKWQTRRRQGGDEEDLLHEAMLIAEELVAKLGTGLAASIVCQVEREYWQTRNTAGQIQKARQDRLGMGWANHDHHTFRASRTHFHSTCRLFEILGFRCRERFYAGLEAGWGAQVMEHPETRLVLFVDVDLSPEELSIDFSREELVTREKLGTIGLWCALHGESLLQAGMHHLEAQFVFEKLAHDLNESGVAMMPPFSNFPHLKQAFTQGEVWKVAKNRIDMLLQKGLITESLAEQFLTKGAIGSHLENLERHDGFKGFNQKAVSDIIRRTDPRGSFGA